MRSANNFCNIKWRITAYHDSFIPSGIKLWNLLPKEKKGIININGFKKSIKINIHKNPIYLLCPRFENIILARLRIGCSALNDHLSNNLHVIEFSTCLCGNQRETPVHYFLHCPRYLGQRTSMLANITKITPNINIRTLLYGNEHLTFQENEMIINSVSTYIKESKRFTHE